MAKIEHTEPIYGKSGKGKKATFNCTCNNVTMEVTIWAKTDEELQTKIKNFLAE